MAKIMLEPQFMEGFLRHIARVVGEAVGEQIKIHAYSSPAGQEIKFAMFSRSDTKIIGVSESVIKSMDERTFTMSLVEVFKAWGIFDNILPPLQVNICTTQKAVWVAEDPNKSPFRQRVSVQHCAIMLVATYGSRSQIAKKIAQYTYDLAAAEHHVHFLELGDTQPWEEYNAKQ